MCGSVIGAEMKAFQCENKTHRFKGDTTIQQVFDTLRAGQMLDWFMMTDGVFLSDKDDALVVHVMRKTEMKPNADKD